MNKMNNKGYMLVEIILAFAITFSLLYFLMDLVLNIKNKNDDLLVETIVRTEQTIITNQLMEYAKKDIVGDGVASAKTFCNNIKVEGNMVKYKENVIDIVDDYATVGKKKCVVSDNGQVSLLIPLDVKQMNDEEFDIIINYRYKRDLKTFAIYSEKDGSLTFYNNFDRPKEGENYKGKIVTKLYENFLNNNVTINVGNESEIGINCENINVPWKGESNNITSVVVEDTIYPENTVCWFNQFINTSSFDVSNINVSNTTNMNSMFYEAGTNVEGIFKINGLNDWKTSKVTDMGGMFRNAGYMSENDQKKGVINKTVVTEFNIGDIGKWDVSKVQNMTAMFQHAGESASTWNIGKLNDWNTSSVVNMAGMFEGAGRNVTNDWNIGDLSGWNTSSVTNMHVMFSHTAQNAPKFDIGNIGGWDVSKVKNMNSMFYGAGQNSSEKWYIGDLSGWNTSNVGKCYDAAGNNTYKCGMQNMFMEVAQKVTSWDIGNIGGWKVSNVPDMGGMFLGTEDNLSSNLDLSGWDIGDVYYCGAFEAESVNIKNEPEGDNEKIISPYFEDNSKKDTDGKSCLHRNQFFEGWDL